MKADLIKEIQSKDIDPQTKEKALAAIERIASTGEYTFFADQTGIADSFDWNDTEEGYDFWYGIAVAKLKSPVVAPSLVIPSSPNIGEAKRVKFSIHHTGYYVCDTPQNQTGEYVKAKEYDLLKEQVRVMGEAIEAVLNSDMAQREEDEGRVSETLRKARAAIKKATKGGKIK
jgi:hypothetical protein